MRTVTGEETIRAALRSGNKIFAISIAFSFLCNILRLTGPIFILLVYDRVLASQSVETLVVLFSLVVAFLITMGMVDYSRRRLLARFGAQFQERLEKDILATTPKEEFFNTGQTKPASGLSDLDAVRGFFNSGAVIALLDVFWAPMFLAVVFVFHWILGWVVVGGIALLMLMYLIRHSFFKDRTINAGNASDRISDLKNIVLRSKRDLKSLSLATTFSDRWVTARRTSRDASIALSDWTTWFSVFSRQAKMFLQYSVLAVGAYLVVDGEITVGAMIASMFLSVRVFVPVDQFAKELPGIRRVLNNWRFLKKTFSTRKQNAEHEELWDLEPSLVLTNVSRRSPLTGQPILRSINLTAKPGEILEISGIAGSGKTVLAETILGAQPRNSGTITFGGATLERLSRQQASRMFAYIPESVRLIDGTIQDNICSLETQPDIERMVSAARLALVHELILGLPDGYQTMIDSDNDQLSRAQRHKIAFARVLYKRPRVLVVDEPDPYLRKALTKIRQALPETTVIVLVRQPISALNPDRRYRLEGGSLKADKAVENVVRIEKRKS